MLDLQDSVWHIVQGKVQPHSGKYQISAVCGHTSVLCKQPFKERTNYYQVQPNKKDNNFERIQHQKGYTTIHLAFCLIPFALLQRCPSFSFVCKTKILRQEKRLFCIMLSIMFVFRMIFIVEEQIIKYPISLKCTFQHYTCSACHSYLL